VASLAVPPPGPALRAAIAAMQPVRTRQPRRVVLAIVFLSIAYAVALLASTGLRPDLAGLPGGKLVLQAIASAGSFVGQLAWSLLPKRGQVLPPVDWAVARATVMSLGGALVGVLLATEGPGSVRPGPGLGELLAHAVPCVLVGTVAAVCPALLGLWALRGAAPMGAWRVALAVGGAAGALAGVVLHLRCAVVGAPHVGLVHGAMMIVPALVSAPIGALLARRRAA